MHDYSKDGSPLVYCCRISHKQGKRELALASPVHLWCNESELTVTSGGALMLQKYWEERIKAAQSNLLMYRVRFAVGSRCTELEKIRSALSSELRKEM